MQMNFSGLFKIEYRNFFPMKMHQLSGSIGSENSKKQKFVGHTTNINRRTFDIPKRVTANGIAKGHLNINGNGRKRSVEPRPHPAKLLNKRYWDDVRAGRVCPPSAVQEEEEDQITNDSTKQLNLKYKTKNGTKYGEKRKASIPLEIASQKAKNNANFRNSSPILVQQRPSPGTFSPPNPALFQPQNIGIVQHGTSLPPENQSLLRFASFLPPPPHQDILRPAGPVFVPPSDAFFSPQFPPLFDSPSTPTASSISSMNLAISPLMMLQQHYHNQQQQFSSSAAETATTATLALIEMLAKGNTTPNGQQQQRNGIFSGQQQIAATTETVKNEEPKMGNKPSPSAVGCPSNLTRNSESDEQIDQLMDQIVLKFGQNGSQQQTQNVFDRNAQHLQTLGGKFRLCFVPIPMPVPMPIPVSTEFILKHFGTMSK